MIKIRQKKRENSQSQQEDHSQLKVLHVHDVAFVGSNLVAGLNEIGIPATFYEIRNTNLHLTGWKKTLAIILFRLFEIFRFGCYVRKNPFNIIHIHFGTFAYLALWNRIPYFLHLHGSDVRSLIHHPFIGRIIRQGIKKAQTVFYSTPDLELLIKPYRPDALFFPNPIDLTKFKPPTDPPDSKLVFNINKLDKFKGINVILDACELLLNADPDLHIRMFNFGNNLSEAAAFLEKHNSNPRVHFIGRVPHEEMLNLLQNSSVVIGQMGTGILTVSELEAMACGKAVVCNFQYDHKYLSPPPICYAGTALDCKNQVYSLLNTQGKRMQIGEQACQWVLKNADRRFLASRLSEIYQNHL